MDCYLQCSGFLKSILRFLGPRSYTYQSILKWRYNYLKSLAGKKITFFTKMAVVSKFI